jgi:hypothetical protein
VSVAVAQLALIDDDKQRDAESLRCVCANRPAC